MPVKVRDPQQNKHRWWGTLTNDKSTIPYVEDAGKECVFIKTSRFSHYITQGTGVKDWNVLSATGDITEALKNISNVSQAVKDRIKADVSEKDFPKKMAIVEIVDLDDASTTPLVKKMNAFTKDLFTKRAWSKNDAKEIGVDDIELGFKIRINPKPRSKK